MSLDLNIIATAASALVTLLAFGIKVWRRPNRLYAPTDFKSEGDFIQLANERTPEDPSEPAQERLREVRAALDRQTSIASTNRWTSSLLTIGQYIIGGLLASSFVQQSLRPDLVGVLGLLVLISSLIYQHFRPDIQLRGAMSRALRLRAVIRSAEDDLYAIRSNSPTAPTVESLRRRLSEALSSIESSELQDVQTRQNAQNDDAKA